MGTATSKGCCRSLAMQGQSGGGNEAQKSLTCSGKRGKEILCQQWMARTAGFGHWSVRKSRTRMKYLSSWEKSKVAANSASGI